MDRVGKDDDDALFLVDNLDQVEDYSVIYSHFLHSDFIGYTHDSTDVTILLDSCSTVIIVNKSLLRGIH